MSLLSGFENQKRIIYLIMFAMVIWPIVSPIGLPISVSTYTSDYYNVLESLPAGSVVLYHYGGDAASWGELGPQVLDTTQYLMERDLKVIYFSTWPMGSQWTDYAIQQADKTGKVYGVDYINLGYIAGFETGIASLASDFHGVVNVDYYGNSIEGTLLDDVQTGEDIDLIMCFDSGSGSSTCFINQFQNRWSTPIISGETGVMLTTMLPYYQSGQISGILSSTRGAGEFEILTGEPGQGVISTDVLSTTHVWLIISIVIGNVIYFTSKKKKGGEK